MIKALIKLMFLPIYMCVLMLKLVLLPFTILFGGTKKGGTDSYNDGFDDGLLVGWFLFDDWD